MTDFEPSDRDELVAAYLDNEASAAERAQVEADPELLARVEAMRQVADLVAESVVPPHLELRNQHIANALSVSATATNVTSLAPRRRWSPQFAGVLSAAAAIMLILFVGSLVLLSGSDDADETASTVTTADQADDGGGDDAAAADEPATEAASLGDADDSIGVAGTELEAPANTAADDAGSDDDGADEQGFGTEAPVEEAAEEAVEEEEVVEDAPVDVVEAAADGGTFSEFAPDAVRYTAGDLPNIGALADAVGELLSQDETDGRAQAEFALLAQLQCAEVLLALAEGSETLLVGTVTIAGEGFEYLVVVEPEGRRLIVLDTQTCGIFDDIPLQS